MSVRFPQVGRLRDFCFFWIGFFFQKFLMLATVRAKHVVTTNIESNSYTYTTLNQTDLVPRVGREFRERVLAAAWYVCIIK